MPSRPSRPCSHPGCPALVTDGSRCPAHRRTAERVTDQRRGTAASRGYGGRWQRARVAFLARHPLCSTAACGQLASVVDHITPHKGDQALFWDTANWQSLCKRCHDRKTAATDGGFGRDAEKNGENASDLRFYNRGRGEGQKSGPSPA